MTDPAAEPTPRESRPKPPDTDPGDPDTDLGHPDTDPDGGPDTEPASRDTGPGGGRVHPAVVVVAADVALLAVFAVPAVARWARAHRSPAPGDGSTLALPELSFAALERPMTMAALAYDGWRPGVAIRVAVVLALHALLAAQVAGRAAPGRAHADVRLAVLAASPLLGGLAGLTTVVPSALALGTTVEEREVARELALASFRDGATWGLVAGVLAALALTGARRRTAAGPDPDPEPAEELGRRAVERMVRAAAAAGPAAAGTALALVAVLGSRPFAAGPYAGEEARRLLGYLHWAVQLAGNSGYQRVNYVPLLALPFYLYCVLLLGAVAGAVTVRRPPLLRMAATWWAVTVALAAYAGFAAVLRTVAGLQQNPNGPAGSPDRFAVATVNDVVDALPALAAYTALVGWVPALVATAAVGRSLRRAERAAGAGR